MERNDRLVCRSCGCRFDTIESFARAGHKRGRQMHRAICHSCNAKRSAPSHKTRQAQRKRTMVYIVSTEDPAERRKNYMREWARQRRQTEEGRLAQRRYYERNKLAKNFSSVLRRALKGTKCGARWTDLVGYNADDLRRHIERQFTGKMSWDTYGTHWEIDHIVPVSAFSISGPHSDEFRACWALSNLRPLARSANQKKKAKRTHLL